MEIVQEFADNVRLNFTSLRQRITQRKIYYYGGDLANVDQTTPQSVLPVFEGIINEHELQVLSFANRLSQYATNCVSLVEELQQSRQYRRRCADLKLLVESQQRENEFLQGRVKTLVAEKIKISEQRFHELADLQQKLKMANQSMLTDISNEIFLNAKDQLFQEVEQLQAKLVAERSEKEQLKLDILELRDTNESAVFKENRLSMRIDALETKNRLLEAQLNIEKVSTEAQTVLTVEQLEKLEKPRHRTHKNDAQPRYLANIRQVFRPPGPPSARLDKSQNNSSFRLASLLEEARKEMEAHNASTELPANEGDVLLKRQLSLQKGREMLDQLSIQPIAQGSFSRK